MSNPYSLEGKLILVTGGGTGIGQGVALEVARMGADVVINYASSANGAQETVDQIKGMDRRATAIQADLGSVSECYRLVDEAAAFLGGLDGLVNNSGVTLTLGFLDTTEDHFNKIYNLNIRGEFFCAQQAVRHMIKRGADLRQRFPDKPWAGGSIVNVSSVHGFVGCPGHSVYAGTKGAINAFTRELAIELCPLHIRANVLAPGSVEVASYYKNDPTYTRAAGDAMVPWGRIGLPQDCGYMAAFLLSDAAEFMTGHVLYFDGGLTAKMALPIQPREGER
ncbi:MAG: SDR family oxidoreductase [Anaerolineae bacterium]|nr:SDR family oxidoreductase [Anaerolineae bacterium]